MKQNKIGIISGIIFIVAFFITLVGTIIFAVNMITTETQKENYFSELYGLNKQSDEIVNEPVKFPSQEYTVDENSATYKAVSKLRIIHSQSEYFLMGGRVDRYTEDADELWGKILDSTFLQQTEYESIRDSFPAEDELVKDMNNLIALLKIAREQRNLEAMRYMHRILHDIDLYGFPQTGVTAEDYRGATYAVPSSDTSQIDAINSFIVEHS